jgi:anaerobic ribonucleoside-triphosphate reductase
MDLIKPLVQKIAFECEEAGATKWDIIKIIKELNQMETQSERKLKEKAIEMLKKLNPKAAETYSSFDRMVVFTSKQEIEPFDRGNITKSLLKETKIKRLLAEKISSEVEEKIKDLKISHITTSLIREMVCVKLLELGMEEIHNEYTRLGLPVFEVGKKNPSKQVLTEFNLTSKIPLKAKEKHFNSTIFIPFIEDFSSKAYSWNIPLKEEKKEGKEIILDLLKEVQKKNEFFSSSVCISYLNFWFSRAIEKKNKQKINELIEFFFEASPLIKKKFCVTVSLFTPEESNYKANKKNIWFFADSFITEFNERKKEVNFDLIICVENKFQLKLLNKKNFEHEMSFLSLKNNNLKAQKKGLYIKGNGILSLTEINMEKLFIESEGNNKKLMDSIEETIKVIKELNEIKEKELKKRIETQKLKKCISLYGIDSGAMLFSGNKTEAKSIARKAREKIRKEAENFVVLRSFNSSEARKKFAEFNERKFGVKEKEKKLKTTSYITVNTRNELEEAIEKNYEYISFKP